jgi:hypothetical protein
LYLRGRVTALDGGQQIDVQSNLDCDVDDPQAREMARQLGHDLAQEAIGHGAGPILEVLNER